MDKISSYQFVLGFRVWKAKSGFLYPISEYGLSAAWPRERPFKAVCIFQRCGERVASAGCTCGFYAFNSFDTAKSIKCAYGESVVGAVLGWGQIQFYKDGFRAEYAKPIALIDEAFSPSYKVGLKSGNYLKRRLYKFYTRENAQAKEVGGRYNIPTLGEEDFDAYFGQLYQKNRIFIPGSLNVMAAPVKEENMVWSSLITQRYEIYNLNPPLSTLNYLIF